MKHVDAADAEGEAEKEDMSAPEKCAYVTFTAQIRPKEFDAFLKLLADAMRGGYTSVHLLMTTTGGYVNQGVALYEILKGLPINVVAHNIGAVESIGVPVFLAGHERYCTPNAIFGFHRVGITPSNLYVEAPGLRLRIDSMEADEQRSASMISERTDLSTADVLQLFSDGAPKGAEFALQHGFVNEIKGVSLPPGAELICFSDIP